MKAQEMHNHREHREKPHRDLRASVKNSVLSVVIFLIAIGEADGQSFKKRYVTEFDEPLTNIQADWVSMNADTLLDFVITGAGADGQMKIIPYQNQITASYFISHPAQLTGMKPGYMQIADWNRDGKMDLLLSAKTLINTDAIFVFEGKGDFMFQKQAQKIVEHSGPFLVADFNSDAVPDILTFGASIIRVHEQSETTVTVKFELTGLTPASISAFDMDRDGLNDFVVSGHDQQNKAVTSVFYGQPAFKFIRKNIANPVEGPLSLADVNDDGRFDVVVTGSVQSAIMINHTDTLIKETTFDGLANARLFSGDMTSDGKTDLLLSAKKVNYIRELTEVITDLDTTGLILQRMGDQDRDGDLDLVQVIDSIGSQWLKFYENTSVSLNKRPSFPGAGFAISTFNKTFIFWEPAGDDRTDTLSLTYDVWLGTAQGNIIMPSYDLSTARRSVVRHGNAGTSTAMVISGLTDDRYFYHIQTVDNAYNGSYGVCSGGVLPCFDLVHNDVQACKGSEVKLAGGQGSVWFSISGAFLAKADTLKFVAAATDTIFAFTPSVAGDCSKNKIYAVNVNEGPPSERQTIYSCKGKTIKLEITPGWTEVKWDTKPPVANVSSIDYVVNGPDTVTATAVGQGCIYKKQFFIKISEPKIAIEGDGFQVLKGHSVQLLATGNAETWKWEPSEGLSDSTIPNPMATPSVSTEYIVTATDSVGCTATARTNILVQETAFVPNLFTPNGDGKNDNLMIYGLTASSRFTFKIFNREGSVVYETKDLGQASTSGWNGFINGTRQPSGIYYWKVDGEMPNGDKLLLNGKTTGSILLVH